MSTETKDKVYTPLPLPPTPNDLKPPAPLEGVQEEKRLHVLEHFSKEDYKLPNVEKDPALTEAEKFWLTNDCLLRFLRATKWDAPQAVKRLEDTLKWRREFGLYELVSPEHVEPEALTGKEVVFGFDTGRRPGLYMFPSRQNTEESERQVHFATFMLERTLDLCGPGVENVALFINFRDRSKAPSWRMSHAVLNILQNHYPERLGKAYLINIPFLLNAFFKFIMPLVDPVTREKVKFNPNVITDGLVAPDMMMEAGGWGGDIEFEYKHETYWPALIALCKNKRDSELERWRALGGKVGIDEWSIKGGPTAAIEPASVEHAPANSAQVAPAAEEKAEVHAEPVVATVQEVAA